LILFAVTGFNSGEIDIFCICVYLCLQKWCFWSTI